MVLRTLGSKKGRENDLTSRTRAVGVIPVSLAIVLEIVQGLGHRASGAIVPVHLATRVCTRGFGGCGIGDFGVPVYAFAGTCCCRKNSGNCQKEKLREVHDGCGY